MALRQLRGLGLSAAAVRSRVAAGRLHRVHQGVYAVGHSVLSVHGRWMAAVLAGGEGAVLSHRSAAALWGLRPSNRERIEVTVPRGGGRSRPGIQMHRSATLTPTQTTTHADIPTTTVARTLLDLADVVTKRQLERALEQAEILHLLDAQAVRDALENATGRHGAAALRELLADHHPGDTITRNELEERFLALCAAARLPRPRVNAWIALARGNAVQADFLWPAHRLVVETDGHATHGTRRAFERDRRRDQRLMAAGYRVMRCTWRQVVARPGELGNTLAALLA